MPPILTLITPHSFKVVDLVNCLFGVCWNAGPLMLDVIDDYIPRVHEYASNIHLHLVILAASCRLGYSIFEEARLGCPGIGCLQ